MAHLYIERQKLFTAPFNVKCFIRVRAVITQIKREKLKLKLNNHFKWKSVL